MSKIHAYIVSGASSGIGQAIAQKIVEQGHQVFGLSRSPAKLEATAKLLKNKNFAFAAVDLTDSQSCSKMTAEVRKWLSQNQFSLRGLINNAGVVDRGPFDSTADATWDRQFQNNLLSAVRLTRDFYPELRASAPSSVLNISSNLGRRPIPNTSAYSAIKAAMINWTECLALEWAPLHIRVNCICPGLVDTPIHPFYGQDENSEHRQMAHQLSPLGRMGKSDDIAEAAWFLLSESSSWTTGSVVAVDGGMGL